MLAAGLLFLPFLMFAMLIGGDADEMAEKMGNWLKIMFKYPGT